jgi:hypothetical protein
MQAVQYPEERPYAVAFRNGQLVKGIAMPIVFEEPPNVEGPGARFRERSPERQEMDELLSQLVQYPDQWARLYDFPEADKEAAEKHAGKVRSAAGYLETGKSWSVTLRRTQWGWSVFAKMSSEPVRRRPKKDKSAETQDVEASGPVSSVNGPAPAEQVREATFQ